jgi:hypothetical protein
MRKIIIIFLLILLSINGFAQLNYGVLIGSGVNKEVIIQNNNIVPQSKYKISFKTGIGINYTFLKKISINTEINYFYKNTEMYLSENYFTYIEIPIYFGFQFNKFNFFTGISNNLFLQKRHGIYKFYTSSFLCGLSYNIIPKVKLNSIFNIEIMSHTVLAHMHKNYHHSFMLSLQYSFN